MINKSTKMAHRCACGVWISGKMNVCGQCTRMRQAAQALIFLKYGKQNRYLKKVTFG